MNYKKTQCNQSITRLSNHPGFRGLSKWRQPGRNNENLRVLDSNVLTEEKSEAPLEETEESGSKPTIEKTLENELDEISESSLSVDDVSTENWEKISEGSFEHTEEEEYFSDLEILDEHIDDDDEKENEFTVEYRTCVPKYLKMYKALDFYKPKVFLLSNNKFSVSCVSAAVCSENVSDDCVKSAIHEPVESVEPVAENPVVLDMENKEKSPDLEMISCEKNNAGEMHSQLQTSAIVVPPIQKTNNDDDVVIVFDSAVTIVEGNDESVSVANSTATCETKSESTENYQCVADRPNLKICTPTFDVASKSKSGDKEVFSEGEHENSACLKIIPDEVKRTKHCTKHAKSVAEKVEMKSTPQRKKCYRSSNKKKIEDEKMIPSQRYKMNEQDTLEKRSVSPRHTSPLLNKNICRESKLDIKEKKSGERLDFSDKNNFSKSVCSSEDTRVDSRNRNFHRENDSVVMPREKMGREDYSKCEDRGNSNSGNWQFLTAGSRKRKLMDKNMIDRRPHLPKDPSTSEGSSYKTGNSSRFPSKNKLYQGKIPFSKKSPNHSGAESPGSKSSSRKCHNSFRDIELSKKSEINLRGARTSHSGESQLRNSRFRKTESITHGNYSSVIDRHSRERSLTRKRSPDDIFDRDSGSRVSAYNVSKETRVFHRSSTSPKRRRDSQKNTRKRGSPDSTRASRRRVSPDNSRMSRRRVSPDSPRISRRRESQDSYRNPRRESPDSYRNSRRESPDSYRNSRRESPNSYRSSRRESPDGDRIRRASWSKHSGGGRSPRRLSPSNFDSFSKSPKSRSKYSRSPERSRINVSEKRLSRNISRSPERFVQSVQKTSDTIINKFMSSPEHGFQHPLQAYQASQSSLSGFSSMTQPSPESLLSQSQNPMYSKVIDHAIADGIKPSHGVYDSRMNPVTQVDTKLSENQRPGNFFSSVYPHLPVGQGSFNPLCVTNSVLSNANLSNEKLFAGRCAPYVSSVPGFNYPNPYVQTSDLNRHQSDNLRGYSSGSSVQNAEMSQDVFKNMQSVVNKLFGTSFAPQTETNNKKLSLSGCDSKSDGYVGGGNPSKLHDFYSSVAGSKGVLQSDSPHATRVVQIRDGSSTSKFHGDSDNILSLMKNQSREMQNFESCNFQGPSGTYQKTSLVQRLASVLTKLQMADIPEYIISEMLVKIGAFNDSLPSHDISEAQIVAVLRQFNYIW